MTRELLQQRKPTGTGGTESSGRPKHRMPRPPEILRKSGSHKDKRRKLKDKAVRNDFPY